MTSETTSIPAERAALDAVECGHLRDLAARLRDAGYHESAIGKLLDINEIHDIRESITERNLRRARTDEPLAHLCAFWLLGQSRERSVLERLMGANTLPVLYKLGLVEDTPFGVQARAHLFPCLERYLFLDLIGYCGDPTYQVYWLGGDSIALARTAPRKAVDRALDLCTGSGVHAVMAGAHSQLSYGVDINPRALEYSRINAVLNGTRCEFFRGSLYQPLPPPAQFGLITANPPFVPTPRGDLALFRPGGESGEEITAAIVAGLPQHLEVGGTMALVSDCPVIRNSHPLDRVQQWLGGASGWGLAQIKIGGTTDRDNMIAGHITPANTLISRLGAREGMAAYRKEFDAWLDCYEDNGIVGSNLAMTFVRRLQPGRPGWRAEWTINLPKASRSAWVEKWLDAQERFSARATDWSWRPAWGDPQGRLMIDARDQQGLFMFADMSLCPLGMMLEPGSAFLLQQIDGRRTAQQLLESFSGWRGLHPDEVRVEVSTRLDELGRKLLLV